MTEPCCERDHDVDGNCDRHPEPRPAHAKRLAEAPRATSAELHRMAAESAEVAAQPSLPGRMFDASRSIIGRSLIVEVDGRIVAGATKFMADENFGARVTNVDGTVVVPGRGALTVEKFNSSWSLFLRKRPHRGPGSTHTMRVILTDHGLPNPEITEYRGVDFGNMHSRVSLTDIVDQYVGFTFEDCEVVQPIEEPQADSDNPRRESWEYLHSTGTREDLIDPATLTA